MTQSIKAGRLFGQSCLVAITLMAETGCFAEPEDSGSPQAECDGVCDTWCWTIEETSGELLVLALEFPSGTWWEYGQYEGGVTSTVSTSGLAYDGDELVMVAYNGNDFSWLKADMAAQTSTWGGDTMATVTWDGSQYLATSRDGLCAYPDWGALNDDLAGDCIDPHTTSRFAAVDGEVYGAWHSTDTVEVYDWDSGALQRELPLEGWDGWVHGVSVAGGVLHLIGNEGDTNNERLVSRFDAETGAFLDSMSWEGSGYGPTGLWCQTGSMP